jgi:pimeloyl-ACP methyl ester carboxylesterase
VRPLHCTWLPWSVILLASLTAPIGAGLDQQSPETGQGFVVFFQSRPVGREEATLIRQADGWIVRGNSRVGPPLDAVTRIAEVHYTSDWHPTRLLIEGTSRGQDVSIKTAFADGKATSEISIAGKQTSKSDAVAPDTVVLPNAFLGSYAVLARRLAGLASGASLRAYIAPQAEVPIRVDGVYPERIETAQRAMAVTRYALMVTNPGGEIAMNLWADSDGALLRFNVPLQGLELAREDIASAASRTTAFSLLNDESVRIPSLGFNLAASLTRPPGATGKLPALILVGGSGPTERDAVAYGVPIIGQIAGRLADAGFLVVRYDKRGVGQSGGRAEGATIADYVEDARSVVRWLEKRKDVDRRRIGIVGHSEGAWVALWTAAREKRIGAVAMIAGPSASGATVVLEQQQHLLERMKTPDKATKVDMQKRINAAVLGQGTWEGVPESLRAAADTPWFHSYLSFEPAKVIKDVRQPLLIVQGELDTQVLPHHADKLAELARARKRKVPVDVVKIPGINHLLTSAKTGEVEEYAMLTDRNVATTVTSAIAEWMTNTLR